MGLYGEESEYKERVEINNKKRRSVALAKASVSVSPSKKGQTPKTPGTKKKVYQGFIKPPQPLEPPKELHFYKNDPVLGMCFINFSLYEKCDRVFY